MSGMRKRTRLTSKNTMSHLHLLCWFLPMRTFCSTTMKNIRAKKIVEIWNVIGCIEAKGKRKFFFVVYTERYYEEAGLSYRLISARRAKESEVIMYYDQDQ